MAWCAVSRPTPVGGVWDVEFEDNGVGLAVGVHFDGTGGPPREPEMVAIDAGLDDGDLTTGHFRRLAADRYYWVVRE